MERIIGNLARVKFKLDEAFFYLDEIEEFIQEEALSEESGARWPTRTTASARSSPGSPPAWPSCRRSWSRSTGGRRRTSRRRRGGGSGGLNGGLAVTVSGLTKSYGSLIAVDGISFSVGRGEIFGILGPNGAGKTTTLEMVEGLRRPDAGQVLVEGVPTWPDPRRVKTLIGVQLQSTALFDNLTVREMLVYSLRSTTSTR